MNLSAKLAFLFLSRARKQIGMWIVDCVVVFFRGTYLYVAGCISLSHTHTDTHARNPVGIASSFSTFPVSIAVWPALVATEIDGIFIILFFQRWQFVHKIFPFPRKKKETLLLTTTKRLLHSLNPAWLSASPSVHTTTLPRERRKITIEL